MRCWPVSPSRRGIGAGGQANKYALRDLEGTIVGYLAEDTNSFASALGRQLLRKRRGFVATLMDTRGQVGAPVYVEAF